MDEQLQSLRSKSLKVTPQRRLILQEFLALKQHVSTEEMCSIVRKKDPSIGQATVFRFMKTLAEAGIAQPSGLGERGLRYEPDREHHDHMICAQCGAIAEFKSDIIEREQRRIARSLGYQLKNHRMELYGLCSKCAKKESK